MKNTLIILFISFCILNCSSSDDSDDQMNMGPLPTGHYSLRLNGAGFSEQLVEVFRDTINPTGNKIIFSSSDDFGNGFTFAIPQPLSEAQFSIGEYEFVNPSWAKFTNNGTDIYLSENGNVTISNIIDNGNYCNIIQGNLSINFTLDGIDNNDILNIQGTFDVPSYSCEN